MLLKQANILVRQKGFTLIELLVVISIIGLLSSIVLASLAPARAKARDAQRQSTLDSVRSALELYYADHNAYPAGTFFSAWNGRADFNYNTAAWGGGTDSTLYGLVSGKYIPNLPNDPGNYEGGGGNFLGDNSPTDEAYFYTSDGQGYVLGTNLETGDHSVSSGCGNYQIKSTNYSCPL